MVSTARCWPFLGAHVLESVRACAGRDIGGLIRYSPAAFAEAGEKGKRDQEQIAAIAQGAGLALQGPNCLGMINYVDAVPLVAEAAPFDEAAGSSEQGVAVVSQSGAMASAVRVALHARGIGVSYSVSTGNEASLGAEDFLEEFIADRHTRVDCHVDGADPPGEVPGISPPGRAMPASLSSCIILGAAPRDVKQPKLTLAQCPVTMRSWPRRWWREEYF